MKNEALKMAKSVYETESECIKAMLDYFDEDAFGKAVELLKNAPRIGATGCGHSGIMCQHFAHLMCCIERPARFISPAEAVHGASGYLKKGDVMLFASRGGKTAELLPILGHYEFEEMYHCHSNEYGCFRYWNDNYNPDNAWDKRINNEE